MEVDISFVQILMLSAIINGIVFSLLLIWKPENKNANRFLSLMIFSISFSLFTQIILQWKMYDAFPWLHWLPFSMTYVTGPAFYFCMRSLTNIHFKFRIVHLWHFSPIILNYLHSIYHLILGRTDPYPLLHNFTEALESYAIISLLVYVFLSYKCINQYRSLILEQVSATEHLNLNWAQQLIYMSALTVLMMVVFLIVDFRLLIDFSMEYSEGTLFRYKDTLITMHVVSLYWLCIGGFRQSQVSIHQINVTRADESKDYTETISKLVSVVEEQQLFLDPALTLTKLSKKSKLPEKEISLAINQQLGKNFYYFINEFRVEEVKKRLLDSQYSHLKILSIAHDSGFNSKPSFNRIFKEFTGQSPKDFRSNTLPLKTQSSTVA